MKDVTPAPPQAAPPWVGVAWGLVGLLALLIGFCWSWLALRQLRLWVCADRYVPAELEVARFYSKPRDSAARAKIEGIIHPGGEPVVATDEVISIRQLDGPEDRQGREPWDGEFEGKRLPVLHWPRQAESRAWWHPPATITPSLIWPGHVVLLNIVFAGAFVGLGIFGLRRGSRLVMQISRELAR